MGGWLHACSHLHAQLPGDHAAVHLRLHDPGLPPTRPGMWRMQTPLLHDPDYIAALTAGATAEATAWAPHTQAARATPAGHRWKAIKARLRLVSHDFENSQKQQQQRSRESQPDTSATARAMAQLDAAAAAAGAAYCAQQAAAAQRQLEASRRDHAAAAAL